MRAVRTQRGVAAVEFALVAVLLLTIAFGAIEFGRAFYQYNTLIKSTRSAVREFTLAGRIGTIGSREGRARCLAVYGKTPCDSDRDTSLLAGLTPQLVGFSTVDATMGGGLPYSYGCVTIVGFQFDSYVPWILPNISFAPITTCMRQTAL